MLRFVPKSSLVLPTYNRQQQNGDHVLYLITRLSSKLSNVLNLFSKREKNERKEKKKKSTVPEFSTLHKIYLLWPFKMEKYYLPLYIFLCQTISHHNGKPNNKRKYSIICYNKYIPSISAAFTHPWYNYLLYEEHYYIFPCSVHKRIC